MSAPGRAAAGGEEYLAQDRVPGPRALPGGSTYEPKWDGFRLAVVGHADGARLWSKSGTDLTARFPEITAAAAAAVPEGTVLDGEVVIWVGDRLDFGLLQRRFTSSRARLADEARQHPASYMVFDLLAVDGQDVRPQPLRVRRALLDELARDWTPPLQRSPVTTDEQLAQQWMRQYRRAGIEGLVVKGAGNPVRAGPAALGQGESAGVHRGRHWRGGGPDQRPDCGYRRLVPTSSWGRCWSGWPGDWTRWPPSPRHPRCRWWRRWWCGSGGRGPRGLWSGRGGVGHRMRWCCRPGWPVRWTSRWPSGR